MHRFHLACLCTALMTSTLSAQSVLRDLIDPSGSGFAGDAEMIALANGDMLFFSGWSMMRMSPSGSVVWLRNYRSNAGYHAITDVVEQPDGDLVAAISFVDVGTFAIDIGWMRANANGIPQDARRWTNAPYLYNTHSLGMHADGSWSILCLSWSGDGSVDAQFRFQADGTLFNSRQVIEGFSFPGPQNAMGWGNELYCVGYNRVRKFDASGNEPWAPVILDIRIERIRPHADGVYFGGVGLVGGISVPCCGLVSHTGELLWCKAILCAEPAMQDDPVFANIDIVHGDAGDLLYVDVNGEDEAYLFLLNGGHEPVAGSRLALHFEPDRLAPTTSGGAALYYSEPNSTWSTIHTIDASLNPTGCAEPVPFTTLDLTVTGTSWFNDEFIALNSTWTPVNITSDLITISTTPNCVGVGITETGLAIPRVYPLPAHTRVHVDGLPAGPMPYRLFDANGRAVREGLGNGPAFAIDVQGLSPAVHVLQVGEGYQRWSLPVPVAP